MLKILHVASFIGNIGDNASHAGLYNILDKFSEPYLVDCVEIREFYLNYKAGPIKIFDESFVSCANKYDLVVIGGGGSGLLGS